MSILIKGMGIPTAGLYIVSVDNTNGRDKIVATIERMLCIRDIRQIVGTFELVQVPSHGRLIDVDVLKKIVADPKHMDAEIYNGRTFYSDHLCVGADYDDVCAAIDETPTVIDAEEGE